MEGVCKDTVAALLLFVLFCFVLSQTFPVWRCCFFLSLFDVAEGRRKGRGRRRQSYTLVVECPWGKFVLFCPPLKVLNVCKGCIPVSVLGIIVMVFGVISGMSSGDLRSVRV